MKRLISLPLLAMLAISASSCSTSVRSNTSAGVHGKSRSSHHNHSSGTKVKANVGTSINL